MIKDLAKVANKLDSIGLTKEADFLDKMISKLASHYGEDQSYYGDTRVTSPGSGVGEFDEKTMTITIEDDEDGEIELPAKFETCPVCYGKGTHVNPSIDAGGISEGDEFWDEDQDEQTGESRYARGDYDVTCYTCDGKRVTPVVDRARAKPEDLEKYDEQLEADADYRREVAAERRFGA